MAGFIRFKKSVHGWLVLDADGQQLGEVLRATRIGPQTYWRASGTTALWMTRREAAGYLLEKRKGIKS